MNLESQKDISAEKILTPFFEEHKRKAKWYIEWNGKQFDRHPARGGWMYNSKGMARRQLIDSILGGRNKDLLVYGRDLDYLGRPEIDWDASFENIGWYVDKLEELGVIQYIKLEI